MALALLLRHIAHLGDTLLVDPERKALEGLIAAELRLDDRYIAGTVYKYHRLGLALQRRAEMTTCLITPRIGMQYTQYVSVVTCRQSHKLRNEGIALLQVVSIALEVGNAINNYDVVVQQAHRRIEHTFTL